MVLKESLCDLCVLCGYLHLVAAEGCDMDILQDKIRNVSVSMEYSLDDKASWPDCSGSTIDVTFAVGNRVWVREIDDADTERFLGQVEALSGRADLMAWKKIYIGIDNWSDVPYGKPDETRKVFFWFNNIGDTQGYNANHRIKFYLSTDRIIEAESADNLILDLLYNHLCPTGEVYGGQEEFTVPSVAAGTYYIGCIIDATNVISELNEGNNVTPPDYAAQFIVKDTSVPSIGAFKFVNSWGTSGDWETIKDGHYWVTYKTMKKQEMMITYYYNDFSGGYEPRLVAVFKLTHSKRVWPQIHVRIMRLFGMREHHIDQFYSKIDPIYPLSFPYILS